MDNNLNIRKVYVDTRYKLNPYGSNTDFSIEFPQTVDCPENTVMFVDEIVLPNTITTIQAGVNDKIYFALKFNGDVQWRAIPLPEQNYTIQSLADKLQVLMNAEFESHPGTFHVDYDVNTLTLTIWVTDNRTEKPDNMRWRIFTDDSLKIGAYMNVPIANPTTCNEVLQNFVQEVMADWTLALIKVDYHVDLHTTRNLYLLADIGEFRTITNFPWSGSSVLKKIQMSVPFNETLFYNVVMPYDCTHVGQMSFNRLRFRLVNSKGLQPNLKHNWSFSLIFERL